MLTFFKASHWPVLKFAFLVFIAIPLTFTPAYGQPTAANESSLWFRGGYDPPTGIGLELAFQRNTLIMEARFTTKEVNPDDASGSDLALLIGLAPLQGGNFHVSVTGGAALTFFDDPFCEDDGRACLKSPVPALAASLHASFRPTRFLGIGIFLHSNLNSEESFGVSGLMIELGNLR